MGTKFSTQIYPVEISTNQSASLKPNTNNIYLMSLSALLVAVQ